jgi:hypothetical protein
MFFNIRTQDRDFLMRADTKEIKDMWVKAIKDNSPRATEEKRPQLQKKGSNLLGHVASAKP